jgi:hypothetical protein
MLVRTARMKWSVAGAAVLTTLAMLCVPAGWAQARAAKAETSQDATGRTDSTQAGTAGANCAHVLFSGEVTRGQEFDHMLPNDLEFHLFPAKALVGKTDVSIGWTIFIGRPGDRSENYIGIATPPYHGPNAGGIEAWHFRNEDNTGPNTGQVNVPTDIRDFSFVLNEAEYQKLFDAVNLVEHVPNATAEQRPNAEDFLLHGPRQPGRLTIVEMKLGGLEKGTQPWFESMKFNVDLCFPPSYKAPK